MEGPVQRGGRSPGPANDVRNVTAPRLIEGDLLVAQEPGELLDAVFRVRFAGGCGRPTDSRNPGLSGVGHADDGVGNGHDLLGLEFGIVEDATDCSFDGLFVHVGADGKTLGLGSRPSCRRPKFPHKLQVHSNRPANNSATLRRTCENISRAHHTSRRRKTHRRQLTTQKENIVSFGMSFKGALPLTMERGTAIANFMQRGRARRIRYLTPLTVLLVSMASSNASAAVEASCKWSTEDVPVYINEASFAAYGLSLVDIENPVLNAVATWFYEGQARIRPYYVGPTTRTNALSDEILITMEDYDGTGNCSLARTFWNTPVCGGVKIVVFNRVANSSGTCRQYPISWATGYPSPRQHSLQNVITHEFGHALAGWSDEYDNEDTVMQACPLGSAPSAHLYYDDMALLRWDGSYGYGIRLDHHIYNQYSVDGGGSWNALQGETYHTNMKVGATSNNTQSGYMIAHTDPMALGALPITTRMGDGNSFNDNVVFHETTQQGVALTRTADYFVMAYVESGQNLNQRRIKIRRSTDGVTWSDPIVANEDARSDSTPTIAWNSNRARTILAWVDRDSDLLKYSVSANQGASWTTPQVFFDGQELLAFQGPDLSCNNSNQCLLVWPSWNNYGGVWPMNNVCTLEFRLVGEVFDSDHGSIRCPSLNTGREVGVEWGNGSAFSGWVMARTGRDASTSVNTHNKTQFSMMQDWSSQTVLSPSTAGVDLAFNGFWNEWEVFYVAP